MYLFIYLFILFLYYLIEYLQLYGRACLEKYYMSSLIFLYDYLYSISA